MEQLVDKRKTIEYQMGYKEGYQEAQMEFLKKLMEITQLKVSPPPYLITIKTE